MLLFVYTQVIQWKPHFNWLIHTAELAMWCVSIIVAETLPETNAKQKNKKNYSLKQKVGWGREKRKQTKIKTCITIDIL